MGYSTKTDGSRTPIETAHTAEEAMEMAKRHLRLLNRTDISFAVNAGALAVETRFTGGRRANLIRDKRWYL